MKTLRAVITNLFKWAYLLFFFAIAVLPLVWLILTSFKTEAEFNAYPLALPAVWQLQNYVNAVSVAKMHVLFMNSVIIATTATLLNIMVTSLASFVVSREDFPFRQSLSNVIVAGVLMPIVAFMVPYLAIIRNLGLYDTRAALILTYAAINIPISFFLIKSFMVNIPKDLEDAAIIDGCSFVQRYTKVVLPLSRSGLVTAGTLTFIWSWNEFIYALLLPPPVVCVPYNWE